MPPRLFNLSSTWHLPAAPQQVWAIIADIDMSWPQWWPHCSFAAPLGRTEAKSNSQEDILKATTAYLNFKASLGYTLTISIHPTAAIAPREVDFDAGGHLQGIGRVTLLPENQGQATRMDIEWRVHPTQGWMNLLTPIAAPAFTAAHSLLSSVPAVESPAPQCRAESGRPGMDPRTASPAWPSSADGSARASAPLPAVLRRGCDGLHRVAKPAPAALSDPVARRGQAGYSDCQRLRLFLRQRVRHVLRAVARVAVL